MNRNFIRLVIGGLLAIPVAGGLFFIMQYLIASADPKIDDSKQRKLADIHMPEREIETNTSRSRTRWMIRRSRRRIWIRRMSIWIWTLRWSISRRRRRWMFP